MSEAALALLKDRVAVITGASRERGIGLATARLFASHGARVVVLDLDGADAAAAAASLGHGHIGLACDVTDAKACKTAVQQVLAQTGTVDVLVNNAGLTQRRRVMEVTDEDYALVTSVILKGTLNMSQAVIPVMRERGRGAIVCISSQSAQQGGGVFGGAHYCAAKAGVLGLSRAMARELAPENIRVNAVTPGLILTDFSRGANPDANKHESARAFPMGRVGRPEEVAGVCLFLASELSSYMTGATLDVNGGAHMH
jgi:NAD(P)-dependent dehydrogenase (short-subunit alcohol dehydrogenase family)